MSLGLSIKVKFTKKIIFQSNGLVPNQQVSILHPMLWEYLWESFHWRHVLFCYNFCCVSDLVLEISSNVGFVMMTTSPALISFILFYKCISSYKHLTDTYLNIYRLFTNVCSYAHHMLTFLWRNALSSPIDVILSLSILKTYVL